MSRLRTSLTALGTWTASPAAFLAFVAYVALWALIEPTDFFAFHPIATVATWAMTLVIQRAEHRDTQAIHAKLDEIIHGLAQTPNRLTRLDDQEPEDIERHREQARVAD